MKLSGSHPCDAAHRLIQGFKFLAERNRQGDRDKEALKRHGDLAGYTSGRFENTANGAANGRRTAIKCEYLAMPIARMQRQDIKRCNSMARTVSDRFVNG
jgi:hypothetical protein